MYGFLYTVIVFHPDYPNGAIVNSDDAKDDPFITSSYIEAEHFKEELQKRFSSESVYKVAEIKVIA